MGTFTAAFKPALNKEGYGKLTFLGSSTQSGEKEDGSSWDIFKLTFEVMGAIRGVNQKILVVTNFAYEEDNLLGKTMRHMGFIPVLNESVNMIEDDMGFMVIPVAEDEDGFHTDCEVVPDIDGFFKKCEGQVYLAKVCKVIEGKRKGFWEIDVDSLKPFVKA